MADSQDVNTLRRRGRRRLVGAIALVLLAAIILPMVFDPERNPSAPPVSVRIPGEDEASFAPKIQTPPSVAAPAPASVTGSSESPKPAVKPIEKPEPAASTPEATPQAAPASGGSNAAAEQFVVPVAALASQEKVKELLGKLKAGRLPHYTEPLATAKGTVTRIRVGPYATREAAEEARRQIKRLGLKPGNVVAKS